MSTFPPVLLIAFNRPDETARVIARLREIKPPTVYFAVDGSRNKRPEEAELVEQTRKLVYEFDWPCEIHTMFQSKNLGCGLGVSTAITWVLSKEESVIVLEDDVIPDESFFPFCEELLERYKEDDRVFAIAGCSFVPPKFLVTSDSYRFTPEIHVWGWAIWKRSWEKYVFDIHGWKRDITLSQLRRNLGGSWLAAILWRKTFDLVAQKKIDTWDYQLALAALKSNALFATSNYNLTENIGFGNTATHTRRTPKYIRYPNQIDFPLSHPEVKLDAVANKWTQKHVNGATFLNGISLFGRYLQLLFGKSNQD